MAETDVLLAVRAFMNLLAQGDYAAVIAQITRSRLSADGIGEILKGYGATVMGPPSSAYGLMDTVRVVQAAIPTWSVRMPLWTREEGRSDLTVELTIVVRSGRIDVELDDIHVL